MFDPSAYENIRVVLEGLIYDFDLNGEILVIERNDIVNLADLSRTFNLKFTHKKDKNEILQIKIELHASVKQIASEWIPMHMHPGADLSIQFRIENQLNEILEKRLIKLIKQKYENEFECEFGKWSIQDERIKYYFTLDAINPVTEDTIDRLQEITSKTIDMMFTIYESLGL